MRGAKECMYTSLQISLYYFCMFHVGQSPFASRLSLHAWPRTTFIKICPRLLPNRSPVAWGSQRIALGTLIFHSNTFHFICWAPKFSAFSYEGPFKIFLGSSLDARPAGYIAASLNVFNVKKNSLQLSKTCFTVF